MSKKIEIIAPIKESEKARQYLLKDGSKKWYPKKAIGIRPDVPDTIYVQNWVFEVEKSPILTQKPSVSSVVLNEKLDSILDLLEEIIELLKNE